MDCDPSLQVSGFGRIVVGAGDAAADPAPFLKVRKSRKFMGVQDDLAVVAAGRALAHAGLAGRPLGERTGLWLAVGYIPFERSDMDALLRGSVEDGRFSMRRFAEVGFRGINPLLTFRCLSNMPAYHVSANFDVQGPYGVTYPGAGQFYLALEEALAALADGIVDRALVGGVAHQQNFLVARHFARVVPSASSESLRDAAGFLVLERAAQARERGAAPRGRLVAAEVGYRPYDPFGEAPLPSETLTGVQEPYAPGALGPASLPAALGGEGAGRVLHELSSRDGLSCRSEWEIA